MAKNRVITGWFLAFFALALSRETVVAQPGDLTKWKALAEGGAQSEIIWHFPPDTGDSRPDVLQLIVRKSGERVGIVCADMGKAKLRPGQFYDLSFSARTQTLKTFALTVSLEGPDGKKVFGRTTLPEVGGTNWMHYSVALNVHQSALKYRMVVGLAETGTLWLKDISFARRKAGEKNSKR